MSATFTTVDALAQNGKWQPRKTESLTCPSGVVVQVRRPGPEFALRAGRITRSFSTAIKQKAEQAQAVAEGSTAEEVAQDAIDKMSDEELAAVVVLGREMVVAMIVSPKLVLNPRPGYNEIGPDDIGNDFWFLFNYALEGFYGLKVPVGEQEVEVADLNTFREESGVSGDSVDGKDIRTDAEQSSGD